MQHLSKLRAPLSASQREPMFGIDPNGFYQTPNSMAIKAINANLTGADWKLWAYLQALDPHGDRMKDLEVAEIIKAIKISIRQFKRSLKRLEDLGLYYSEPVILRGQNLAGKLAKEVSKQKKQSKFSVQDKMTDLPIQRQDCRSDDKIADPMTDLPIQRQDCRNQPPESLPSNDSKPPHTIQTYSDFKHTLSENERESFENFVRDEWRKLTTKAGEPGEEILSFERFLAREEDIKNWWQRFLNSSAGRAAKNEAMQRQYDWENDPRLMDWLHKAYWEGHPWAIENEAEREQRLAFYKWAQTTNAYAGRVKHDLT